MAGESNTQPTQTSGQTQSVDTDSLRGRVFGHSWQAIIVTTTMVLYAAIGMGYVLSGSADSLLIDAIVRLSLAGVGVVILLAALMTPEIRSDFERKL